MNDLVNFVAAIITTFTSTASVALPVHKLPASTPTASLAGMIIRSGQYSYEGQTLKYKVYIPQKGGKLTGSFSGVCSGPIEGTFDAGPGQAAQGEASAICPILLNKKLKTTYVAHFNFQNGKAYIDWVGDIPYTSGRGSFTMDFEPVN